MARATSKSQLLDEIARERRRLDDLLASIPADRKLEEVADGLSVKDLLAHRTEWGRMLLRWHDEARAGRVPAVPTPGFKWNQLPALNAQIQQRFADVPLERVEAEFADVHDRLYTVVEAMDEEELFGAHFYPFTGNTTLAAYVTSASAAHYRSATKLVRRWWKAQRPTASSA
ncbi:MAG: ClbS/DfsB family four-helix bundle protein [Nitriliruptoraceae bacterium]